MIVLNDLYDYNLKIYQDTDKFKFSLDSLLLAEFVEVKKSDKVLLDLCTGNAPIPLILANRFTIDIVGIEIQKSIFDLAVKSIKYNKLNNQIKLYNINALDIKNYFPGNNFDIITCNPPFFKYSATSLLNESNEKAIARHELTINLEQIISLASIFLKENGRFYMVHRPERLEEITVLANKYKFHIKEIELIYSNINNNANMVLIKLVKNGKSGLRVKSKIIDSNIKTYQNLFERVN